MKINDIVFVIGKYVPDPAEKPKIIEAKIAEIKHRQFVAYDTSDCCGSFSFSKKHIGKLVFSIRKEAEKALKKVLREWEK